MCGRKSFELRVAILAALLALAPSTVALAVESELPFSEELAELGDVIFDDQDLSIGRNQGCNACHSSAWGFTGPDEDINAHGAVYEGSIPGRFGDRKPPSSAYSTRSPVFAFLRQGGGLFVGGNFWDGRATGEKLGNPAADQACGRLGGTSRRRPPTGSPSRAIRRRGVVRGSRPQVMEESSPFRVLFA